MDRREIRNNNNMIIGWIDDSSDQQRAFHLTKGYVGYYAKSPDITFDKDGRIYCYGFGLADLIREAERK